MNKNNQNNTSIKVFCRLRPLNALEKSTGGEVCLTYNSNNIKIKVKGDENPYDFGFDGIFGPETSQSDVFNNVAKPVLDGVMQGYNGTIFAYGQTSSGKTFTMEGPSMDSEEFKGIIPRMMTSLFTNILNANEKVEFSVKVSFLEIYNEKIQDLLDPRKNNLQIKEDKTKGIFIQDATEIYVNSADQMKQVMKTGAENRTIAATRMNERSSRSHSIFILYVYQKDTKTEGTKQSKLYFVDLAGSEKIAKTQVSGQQLEEAKNINKSLTTLGMVITALTEKKEQRGHVPYRDSKLTRILQESLGGNSQTSLILACSMCSYNDKETLSTFRFGNRAKNIKNTPIVNAERSAKELMILLELADKKIKEQDEIINKLQLQLETGHFDTTMLESLNNLNAVKEDIPKIIEKPEVENIINKDKEANVVQSPVPNASSGSHGSASLIILKQHIQIVSLNEMIQNLQTENKELETDINNKNQEIYDLNEKVLILEKNLNKVITKNFEDIKELQLKLEKVCYENQEKTHLISKIRREWNRLKSDLSFLHITKKINNIQSRNSRRNDRDHEDAEKEDMILNSIQSTIAKIEEIHFESESLSKESLFNPEIEKIVDNLVKSPRITPTMQRKFTPIAMRKSQDFLTQTPTNSQAIQLQSGQSLPILTTPIADELKLPMNAAEEESDLNIDKKDSDLSQGKADGEHDDDTLQKIIDNTATDEEKILELHDLIMNQRKTISSLSKMNSELSLANQKFQSSLDKKISSYNSQITQLQKFNTEKVMEYETNISNLKLALDEKVTEIKALKLKIEQDSKTKNQLVNDLKYQNDKLMKTIQCNNLAKRVTELESRIKEYGLERQKLFEDLYKLRREVDEKDDLTNEKNAQIQILQNNLNTLSRQLETLQFLHTTQNQNLFSKKLENDEKNPQPTTKDPKYKEVLFSDKNIVKPLVGGGGNIKNFHRNNYLMFDKEAKIEEPSLEARRNASVNRVPLTNIKHSNWMKADKNFKKFEEILKLKLPNTDEESSPSNKSTNGDNLNFDDFQKKVNILKMKPQESSKGIKGIFDSVKNLFS